MKGFVKTAVLFTYLLITSSLFAAEGVEQLQIPLCLAAHLPSYDVLAADKNFTILSVPVDEVDTVSRKAHQVHCGKFVNVSMELQGKPHQEQVKAAQRLLQKPQSLSTTFFTAPLTATFNPMIEQAIAQVDGNRIWDWLTHLTSFTNRSAILKNGLHTAEWLKETFDAMAIEYGRHDARSFFVNTGPFYKQPSLVTVLGKDINAPAIVIGAHMDTLGQSSRERMPGAGDDGSGSASVMEVARILMASDVKLTRPVYIIWYAAEERGLVGSQQVVRYFKQHAIPVHAAIQFDMTGYRNVADEKTIWIYRDYTDQRLNELVAHLIKTYVGVPVAYSECGYGCSDHASWMAQGIPAAFPCETSFEEHNPFIHSASDTMDLLNLEHMVNFTKLGLAFAIELAANDARLA